MKIFILIFFVPLFSFGESEFRGESLLEEEITTLENELEKSRSGQKTNERYLLEVSERIKASKREIESWEKINSERDRNKEIILSEIKKIRQEIDFKKPFGSNREALYSCIESSLASKGVASVYECRTKHPIGGSTLREKEFFKQAEETLSLSAEEVRQRIKSLKSNLEKNEKNKKQAEDYLAAGKRIEEKYQKDLDGVQKTKDEYSLLRSFPKSTECNSSSPEINLENEVPFPGADFKGFLHGVPRDNQDGVGTCYANVGRILLLAATEGEVNASFLDMALQYKSNNKELAKEGLDGGVTCEAIKAVTENGYCPQSEAPLENGEKNPVIETLLGKNDYSMYFQASTLKQLKEFIASNEVVEKKGTLSDPNNQKKAQFIIQKMKENPNLKLPLPVARIQIPPLWKLRASYSSKQASIGVSEEKFLEDHQERYKKFFPKYLTYLNQNKSRQFIFEAFIKDNQDFIDKYQLNSEVSQWLQGYLLETEEDADPKKFRASFDQSLNFLKEISQKSSLSHEEFLPFCGNDFSEEFEMINKLHPLVKKISQFQVDPARLLDADGDFKKGSDLMQLAVAPGCLNPENRKKIDHEFSCLDQGNFVRKIKKSDLSSEEQLKVFRERILLSLLQGLPVGNSFKMSSSVGHINTVVGMRFNSKNNQCEYLIRESQDGTSKWTKESEIFQKVDDIVEVRK